MSIFTASEYRRIYDIVFEEGMYPGYRPEVVESPNGDGKWDTEKRYAHIAEKYLKRYAPESTGPKSRRFEKVFLEDMLDKAHDEAVSVAIQLGVPRAFWPDRRYGAMRVLEYAGRAVTHPHVDFDLFTLMCYRNIPEDFKYCIQVNDSLRMANKVSNQIHFGEILELVIPEYKATPHEVVADPMGRSQYSIVYFSIPDHDSVLPDGQTVGEWLDERLSRSRRAA